MNKDKDIDIRGLQVHFGSGGGAIRAVDSVTTLLRHNEVTGIIGESGCGKSVLGMALLSLLPPWTLIHGSILIGGEEVLEMEESSLRSYRRNTLALIPQNPSTSLNPTMRVRKQITESIEAEQSEERYSSLMKRLFADPAESAGFRYPFQLSGGMKERVLAAIGMIREPEWLLADEPTKGLDGTNRESVVRLLSGLAASRGSGIILITHDIGLAFSICGRILVMYGGHIVEDGRAEDIRDRASHPYTKGLLASLPENGFQSMPGLPLALSELPKGCRFFARCGRRREECGDSLPDLLPAGASHQARCFLYA